jgi:SRSO17 transposase
VAVILKAGPEALTDLVEFLDPFTSLLLRSQSRHALERYTTGLLADLPRKTASDLGRSIAGTNGQRLQEFLTRTQWDPRALDHLRVGRMVAHASVGLGVQIIDDTGIAKKGTHSLGVARQYSGTLGRVDNCQVLLTSHYVDRSFDWPITARLYLPEPWTQDAERLEAAKVPRGTTFKTKGEIALDLIDAGIAAGVPTWAVVADAGYGDQPVLLNGLEERGLPYLVGVASSTRFRLAQDVESDPGPQPPPPYQGQGRPRRPRSLEDRVPSDEASDLLEAFPSDAWSSISWREGSKGRLAKSFLRVRVYRVGLRGKHLPSSGWLIGQRPLPGHGGEPKFFFVWGLDSFSLQELVTLAHCRWVIERFYQDAKGELGLDDYEGRFWTGLHRHVALVMLAHCYLSWRRSHSRDESQGIESSWVSEPDEGMSPTPVTGFPPEAPREYSGLAAGCTRVVILTSH